MKLKNKLKITRETNQDLSGLLRITTKKYLNSGETLDKRRSITSILIKCLSRLNLKKNFFCSKKTLPKSNKNRQSFSLSKAKLKK
uniref:Uncharacterized protein n=1 Tax=virus sp. ctLl75 TaxID=2828249 RepID=A0A8S5RB66_9VIRU|nr:MAG TPA: hypothetical protein [virus sp. ctLl75]